MMDRPTPDRAFSRAVTVLLIVLMSTAGAHATSLDLYRFGTNVIPDRSRAISGDGTILSGGTQSFSFRNMPTVWSVDRPDLAGTVLDGPTNARMCTLYRLSFSGAMGAGSCRIEGGEVTPYRILTTGTFEQLDRIFAGKAAEANAISGDGRILAGYQFGADSREHAVYWVGKRVYSMPDIDLYGASIARGVSDSGRIVAGRVEGPAGISAFRWIWNGVGEGRGKVDLIKTPTGWRGTEANDISDDGRVLVGNLLGDPMVGAFRWTKESGVTNLGTLKPGGMAMAVATNGSGAVVVGTASDNTGLSAVRWSAKTGMLTVEQWLRLRGLTIADGKTMFATGISDDGSMITGQLRTGHFFVAKAAVDVTDSEPDPGEDPMDAVAPPPAPPADAPLFRTSAPTPTPPPLFSPPPASLPPPVTTVPPSPSTPIPPVIVDVDDYAASLPQLPDLVPVAEMMAVSPGRVVPDAGACLSQQTGVHDAHEDGTANRLVIAVECRDFDNRIARAGFGTGLRDLESRLTQIDIAQQSLVFELSTGIDSGTVVSAGVQATRFDAEFHRSIWNGAANDVSSGATAGTDLRARLRIDWPDLVSLGAVRFSPHLALNTSTSDIDDFSETGGRVPASWTFTGGQRQEIEAGVEVTYPLTDRVTLVGLGSVDLHRGGHATAQVAASTLPLTLDIGDDEGWTTDLSGEFGAEIALGGGTAFVAATVGSAGGSVGVGLVTGFRVAF